MRLAGIKSGKHVASRLDGNFEGTTTIHLVQRRLVLFELEDICDHTLHVDFAAVKVGHGTREAICL